jgi:dCMP deaminase
MTKDQLSTNPNRIDLDEAYLQMAEIWARRSKAVRKQVGALLVKDKQIISDGYNGMPAGEVNDVCEYWAEVDHPWEGHEDEKVLRTRPEVLHAESNALMKLARNGGASSDGATLYQTMSPCLECAKLIKQAGIKRVIFREIYRITDGIEFLRKRGIEVRYQPRK